jgi:hypothetical protein
MAAYVRRQGPGPAAGGPGDRRDVRRIGAPLRTVVVDSQGTAAYSTGRLG